MLLDCAPVRGGPLGFLEGLGTCGIYGLSAASYGLIAFMDLLSIMDFKYTCYLLWSICLHGLLPLMDYFKDFPTTQV